ncbi:hypothetical protein [Clostridium lacusfryxellense]|uniref:hypothetical protein n=1 Tax=Clostridium lacusfryxellense TaxID=205328 RepID=UPI001C0BA4E2|nr:hypothetical protein [Clostridium lacusfryxellense]MBU3112680.1 hypothetical protein [Clostridium lacusfryxellense]
MSNISSTTVIIIGLIAIILLAFRERKVVSGQLLICNRGGKHSILKYHSILVLQRDWIVKVINMIARLKDKPMYTYFVC